MTGNPSKLLAFALFVALPSTAQDQGPADLVFTNGVIYTIDTFFSRARAVAVKDGKFIKVGSNDDMTSVTGPSTEVIDLQGRMVMPGIIDNHVHAVRGALAHLNMCNFPSSSTLDEIYTAVQKCVGEKQPGDWIEGTKWGVQYADQVTAAMLDKVAPNNPVVLHDNTNHLIWVNSKALEAASITANTPNPPGGVFDRDSSGAPSGVVREKAAALIINEMPPPSDASLQEGARWIFAKLNTFGVTSAMLPQMDAGRLKAYRELDAAGELTIRLQGHWDFNSRYADVPEDQMAARFATRQQRGPVTDLIDPDGVKIYTDGVPNGHGSPYFDRYLDAETNGSQYIDQASLSTALIKFDREGLSVMMHSIGDMAVNHAINAVEAARNANGSGGPRHHISHSVSWIASDFDRPRRLNLTLDISPPDEWYPNPSTTPYIRMLGRERMSQWMPARSMVEAGNVLSYGSDYDNIPEPDPWLALESMITRANPDAPEMGTLAGTQGLDLITAMQVMTYNGAYAMEKEDVTGSIEVGKSADFIVLNQNLFEIDVTKIHETKVLRTVLMGKTVHQADGASSSDQ